MFGGEARWLRREAKSLRGWAAALRRRTDFTGEQALLAIELEEIAADAELPLVGNGAEL